LRERAAVKMDKIKSLHVIGAIAAFAAGTFLHFAYAASGDNAVVALFAPVNESIWEHHKMLFYPYLAFALLEYFLYGKGFRNFLPAKVFSVLAAMLLIVTTYYTYSGILGEHYLILDILTFALGTAAAYAISYKILNGYRFTSKKAAIAAWLLLAATIAAFAVFTFRPPDIGLFADPLAAENMV